MKTREELNTEIAIETLAAVQALGNEPEPNKHELKVAAYQKLIEPKPFSTFGNSGVE